MSGCANPQCPQFGSDHQGVGQSELHPVELSFGVVLFVASLVVGAFIAIGLIQ